MRELEQHAVGIAVHDAFDRAVRMVADRVGVLFRLRSSSAAIGHELPRDRIVRVGGIDQSGDGRCDARWRIARRPAPARRAGWRVSVRRRDRAVASVFGSVHGADLGWSRAFPARAVQSAVTQFEKPMALTILPQLSTSLLK